MNLQMGRNLKQYDKDYMKMAMLKQEEAFRQQVHELHRLYRVQKLLMRDMKAELKRQRNNKSSSNQRRPSRILDLEVLPAEDYTPNDDHSTNLKAEEEAEEDEDLELTLAIGSNKSRRRKKESSFTSDSGVSFSSSSTESGGIQLNGNQWGLFSYQTDERMKMQQQQPPWLLQCLSLNMT